MEFDRTKIYGVRFDCANEDPVCARIADSVGMQNDYVVGEGFVNGGKNDFDGAYPFGAIRLCNVTLQGGKKTVTYEDQPGFSRDGSNGNVMVEIPKFYTKREKIGSVEAWYISGQQHEGFSLEPMFCNGREELSAVYVGAYNARNAGGGVFSANAGFPDYDKTIGEFEDEFARAGYTGYDFAVMNGMWRLMVIEMGCRNLKNVLGGLQHYSYASRFFESKMIKAAANNTVTVPCRNRNGNFFVGASVGFGTGEKRINTVVRTVTSARKEGEDLIVGYDGEDLSDTFVVGRDMIYGVPQKNGLSDCLRYHTGRTDHDTPFANGYKHLLQAFRYRNIENVWGNVWEMVSGLKVKDLTYYFTYNTAQYGEDISQWNVLSYKAPVQPILPNIDCSHSFVESLGSDNNYPLALMPDATGSGTQENKFGGVCYAYGDTDYEGKPLANPHKTFCYVVGAGFDHTWGSAFTVRGFFTEASRSWLYGNRLVLR